MPEQAIQPPKFDSAHDPRSGLGLRLLAVILALAFLIMAGTSAIGREAGSDDATERAAGDLPGTTDTAAEETRVERSELASAMEARVGELGDDDPAEAAAKRWYADHGYRLAWIDRSGIPLEDSLALVEVLSEAGEQGLDPADYQAAELQARLERSIRGTRKQDLDELDLNLTLAFLRYSDDLLNGRLSPGDIEGTWHLTPRELDLVALMDETLREPEGVLGTVKRVEPTHAGYLRLKDAHERYQRIAAAGGWPTVPAGEVVKVGDEIDAQRYRALVERLRIQGYLPDEVAEVHRERLQATTGLGGESAATLVVDEDLERALVRFQDAHGITEDGALGPDTLEQLNVSADDRVRLIALNLERWRWLPDHLGERYVEVNLPGFELATVDRGRVTSRQAVVVGKQGWETPVISERMEHVVVNPYWNVPESILKSEILPALAENPNYLAEKNMEVVDAGSGQVVHAGADELTSGAYRVRQRPGPWNSLGRIKFMFPNEFNVYLHDTPAESAFDLTYRDLSHGCVRVEDPVALADWVFRGHGEWSGERVRRAIRGGDRDQTHVELDEELPVYFLYWTAFVSDDGEVHFRPDLYGYDEKHSRALEGLGRDA